MRACGDNAQQAYSVCVAVAGWSAALAERFNTFVQHGRLALGWFVDRAASQCTLQVCSPYMAHYAYCAGHHAMLKGYLSLWFNHLLTGHVVDLKLPSVVLQICLLDLTCKNDLASKV